MKRKPAYPLASLSVLLALAACGGADPAPTAGEATAEAEAGAGSVKTILAARSTEAPLVNATSTFVPTSAPAAQTPPSDGASAATATAQSKVNACNAIRPFYWEIGHRGGRAVSGSEAAPGNPRLYRSDQPMAIASASKWLYSTYAVQRRGGDVTPDDRRFLTMLSGYVSFVGCLPTQTVDACVAYLHNGVHSPNLDDIYVYGGGHLQVHASRMGLGAMTVKGLAAEMRSQLGSDVSLAYAIPDVAGGAVMSADAYARVLRKILAGELEIGALLGTGKVCTSPQTCGLTQAVYSPVPSTETWHYSLGHWVEDDPVVGDGAFSSTGAFGFYPWIDATKTYYGIVARKGDSQASYPSARCGRLIRKAWLTGIPQ